MDTTTGPAVLGPLDVGADMLAGLTIKELDILNAHLYGGWPKQSAVHGTLNDLWLETEVLQRDCHRAHMARYDALDYLNPPQPTEPEPPAPALPDGVAEADPANPYGSYTDPAGKHGRYDAASPAEVAEGVETFPPCVRCNGIVKRDADGQLVHATVHRHPVVLAESASPLAPPAAYRLDSIERSPNPDYVTEPYCKTCDAWVGLFPVTDGWQHFHGHPHGKREQFDAGHKPDIDWRRLDAVVVPIGGAR